MADDANLDFLGDAPTKTAVMGNSKRKPVKRAKPPAKASPPPKEEREVTRTITLPVSREPFPPEQYVVRKISFQLDSDTAREIQRLRMALASQVKLQRNGRNVTSIHDAIRYLVEQFAGAPDD